MSRQVSRCEGLLASHRFRAAVWTRRRALSLARRPRTAASHPRTESAWAGSGAAGERTSVVPTVSLTDSGSSSPAERHFGSGRRGQRGSRSARAWRIGVSEPLTSTPTAARALRTAEAAAPARFLFCGNGK
eukprot:scaffold7381_cov310-Pinguiococcus_pyrenoidosus.AAC.48